MTTHNADVQWYEAEVREIEARTKRAGERSPVVFYGSSTMRLWDTLAKDMQCENVLNVAFGGSTLEACAWFFERLVVPTNPASLVVYAGDNDLGDGRSPKQVIEYFKQLNGKRMVALPGVPFGFISIKPSPSRFGLMGKIVEANAAIRELLAHDATAFYIDVFSAMLDGSGRPNSAYYRQDGLHLSNEGYRIWAARIFEYRGKILDDIGHRACRPSEP